METADNIEELRSRLAAVRSGGETVGFVPTMGFLHAGHVSLMEASVAANGFTVASIFVNPLQFAANEDLGSYPVDIEGDLDSCGGAGVDLVFMPSVEEMYPPGASTTVTVAGVSEPLEGQSRPTHFAGVATVVAKLFSIVGPCRAYFGAKDWQQVAVVRRMTSDLSLPVEVVACPIIREPDGLALSSRNIYLTSEQRQQATVLRRALTAGIDLVEAGETDPGVVEAVMTSVIHTASLAELDYAAAVQADTLMATGPLHGEIRLLLAVRFGGARLIDNAGCRTVRS